MSPTTPQTGPGGSDTAEPGAPGPVTASQRIRARLRAAGKRYHANDNIAQFIEPGELDALRDEVAGHMQQVLQSLVIDVDGDHNTTDTARRVAKMYVDEVFAGRFTSMPQITEFPNAEHLNELMIIGPITVRSACSHHLCPILGRVWIGLLPRSDSHLIGLSKYARLAQWIMTRPQIQEEAVMQLADVLERKMRPEGLGIVIEAEHFCMSWRGVKDAQARMTNSVMRGAFLSNSNLRREFLALLERDGTR